MRSDISSIESVRLDADLHLPPYAKEILHEQAQRTVHRFSPHFGGMRLHVHLKHEGSQVGCHVNLDTDHGHYAAQSCDWDIRAALMHALSNVELQLEKHVGKHTHPLAH